MLYRAAFFVVDVYKKHASLLRICAPCLRTFYELVPISTFSSSTKLKASGTGKIPEGLSSSLKILPTQEDISVDPEILGPEVYGKPGGLKYAVYIFR